MDVLYDRNARLATLWIFTWLDWKISNWIATHSPVPIADRSSTSVHELLATANASATDATNLPRNANRTSYAKRARNLYAGATGKESTNTTRRNKEENRGAKEIVERLVLGAAVDKEKCTGCGLCKSVCPRRAIELIPIAATKSERGIEIHKNRLQILERQVDIIEKEVDKIKADFKEIKR
jgi:ferredoxin